MQQFRVRIESGINYNLLREIRVACDSEIGSGRPMSDAERVHFYVTARACAEVMDLLDAHPETSFHTMIHNEVAPDLLHVVNSASDGARVQSASGLIQALWRVATQR